MLPKISGYTKSFGKTKCVFFDKIWWIARKNNKIWDKVSNSIKKVFVSEPL